MKKVLVMNFKTGLDRSMRLSLDDPKEDLTPEEVEGAMNLIISTDILNVDGGVAEIAGANIVTTESEQVVFA